MALKIEPNQTATAYHITTGAFTFPYAIDAVHAVAAHPLEWSTSPWSQQDAAASRQRLNEQNKADGTPLLADPPPLSPEDQKALDDHNKAVADAATRLDAYYKKKAEEEKVAAQVAADEALVSSVPPQPDPTVRRPLTPAQLRKQSSMLTPEEEAAKATAEKKADDDAAKAASDRRAADASAQKAANDKITADKIEADRIGNAINKTI